LGRDWTTTLPSYGHSRNGIPPILSPPWSFHLLFFTQIFHLCADLAFDDNDVNVAVSGWRLMHSQIKAKADLKLEDSSKEHDSLISEQ
jgi:hypothetical protein